MQQHVRILTLALLLLLGACSDISTPLPPIDNNEDTPEVEQLLQDIEVSTNQVTPGETVEITWQTTTAGVLVDVQPTEHVIEQTENRVAVQPPATTEYTLTATLDDGDPEVHAITIEVTEIEEPPAPGGNVELDVFAHTVDAAMMHVDLGLPDDYPLLPNDPEFQFMQGSFGSGTATTWLLPPTGNKVTIGYIGEGIHDHEDIGPALLRGYDFCADMECASTDDDISKAFDTSQTYPYTLTPGTNAVGPLVAKSNNNLGAGHIAGPHQNFIEVLPLKVIHREPNYIAPDHPDMAHSAGTPEAFLNAFAYALGVHPEGFDDLPRREAVDIIYLDVMSFHNPPADAEAQTSPAPTPAEVQRLDELFQLAVEKDVLIVTRTLHLTDEVEPGVAAPFAQVASNYLEQILPVYTPPNPNNPIPPFLHPSLYPYHTDMAPIDVYKSGNTGEFVWGGYSPSPESTTITGLAALLKHHHPELGGRQVRQLLFDASYVEPDMIDNVTLARIDTALGFPGPGDTVTVTLRNSRDEILEQHELTLDILGRAPDLTLNFTGGDTFTLEATASGRTYTLTSSTTFTTTSGYLRIKLPLDNIQ